MQDLGIVRPGSPVRILWGSYDGGTGASITATAYAVGDIKIFKDGGTTERASTSGYVVDDDFSAETGIHLAEFDLADNTTAGFFVAGSEYIVMVGPVTIDTQTVNFPLCRFVIGYPGAILDTGIASLTSATQFILDNGPAEADVLIGCPVILHDVASAVQFAFGIVSDYIVTTKEVFLEATPVGFTPAATDNVSFFMPSPVTTIADAVWDEILTGASHNIATSAGKRLREVEEAFILASGIVVAVGADGRTITLDAGAVATLDYYIGQRLEIEEGLGAGQTRVIVAYSAAKVCLLDSPFIVDPDTASLYAVVAADVHVSVSDADLAEGLVAVYTNTTTITLDTGALANADYYKDMMIVFTHGTGAGQAREISAYTAGRVCTLAPPLDTALSTDTIYHIQAVPNVTSVFDIQSRLPAALVSGRMDSNVSAIDDDVDAALQLRDNLDTTERFVVHNAFTPTTTQVQPDAVFFGDTGGTLETTDDHYKDKTIVGLTGVNKGQAKLITVYDGTNKRFTFNAMTAAFGNDDEFIVI